jgi:hypothetical protein
VGIRTWEDRIAFEGDVRFPLESEYGVSWTVIGPTKMMVGELSGLVQGVQRIYRNEAEAPILGEGYAISNCYMDVIL